jgi:hypothetical protein
MVRDEERAILLMSPQGVQQKIFARSVRVIAVCACALLRPMIFSSVMVWHPKDLEIEI